MKVEKTLNYSILDSSLYWVKSQPQAPRPRAATLQEQGCAGDSGLGGRSPYRFRQRPVGDSHSQPGELALPDGTPDLPSFLPVAICLLNEGDRMQGLEPGFKIQELDTTRVGMKRPAARPSRHHVNERGNVCRAGPAPPQGARARAPAVSPSTVARPRPSRPTNGYFLPHSQPIPTLHEE